MLNNSIEECVELVATNGKWEPRDVGYQAVSESNQYCKACTFYSAGSCSLVLGQIEPEGYCLLFRDMVNTEDSVTELSEALVTDEALSDNPVPDLATEPVAASVETIRVVPEYRYSVSAPSETYQLSQSMLKVPLAKKGKWFHDKYGIVEFTEEDFDSIVTNVRSGTLGHTPYITFGHLDEEPSSTDSHRKRGDLVDISVVNDVLYGLFDSKPEAVDAVKAGEYEFASGEFIKDFTDKESGNKKGKVFLRVALTNSPFIPFNEGEKVEALSQQAPEPNSATVSFLISLTQGSPLQSNEEIKMTDINEATTSSEEQQAALETTTTEDLSLQGANPTQAVDLSKLLDQITNTYQTQLDRAMDTIKNLEGKLEKVSSDLSAQQVVTQAFSTSMSRAEEQRMGTALVQQGVSPALVERFSVIKAALDTQASMVKLSVEDKEETLPIIVALSQLLVDAVQAEPVSYEQSGVAQRPNLNTAFKGIEDLIAANRQKITRG